MEQRPLLSLCIATNGVSEWVFPVLDSIYSQEVDQSLYEVVVTDKSVECPEGVQVIREYDIEKMIALMNKQNQIVVKVVEKVVVKKQ